MVLLIASFLMLQPSLLLTFASTRLRLSLSDCASGPPEDTTISFDDWLQPLQDSLQDEAQSSSRRGGIEWSQLGKSGRRRDLPRQKQNKEHIFFQSYDDTSATFKRHRKDAVSRQPIAEHIDEEDYEHKPLTYSTSYPLGSYAFYELAYARQYFGGYLEEQTWHRMLEAGNPKALDVRSKYRERALAPLRLLMASRRARKQGQIGAITLADESDYATEVYGLYHDEKLAADGYKTRLRHNDPQALEAHAMFHQICHEAL